MTWFAAQHWDGQWWDTGPAAAPSGSITIVFAAAGSGTVTYVVTDLPRGFVVTVEPMSRRGTEAPGGVFLVRADRRRFDA